MSTLLHTDRDLSRVPAPRLGIPCLGLALALTGTFVSSAQAIDCADLPAPVIYGVGGSAGTPFIGRLATQAANLADPITVVYSDPGACQAMYGLDKDPETGQRKRLSGTTAKYWTKEGVQSTCALPAVDPPYASWGAMAQEATTCFGFSKLPTTVSDDLGPVSGFSIIVPDKSEQQTISAEALYLIYGFGPEEGKVAPWTVASAVASRSTTSAAGLLLAKAVGIPLTRNLRGSVVPSNNESVKLILTDPAAVEDPNRGLAFVATEVADANAPNVRSLAFQAKGQTCGYWPSSTATSKDKANIRNGHYFMWNLHHVFARLTDGKIADANVARFVKYFTGEEQFPSKPWLDIVAENGNVPECAMHVWRTEDLGPLQSYQPAEECDCYFEKVATGTTTCATCTADKDCKNAAAPFCHHGYCEEK